jgi:hypothetical protein
MNTKRLCINVLVTILTISSAVVAAAAEQEKAAPSGEEESLVGVVIKKPPFDTCMQGNITHLLISGDRGHKIKTTRLVGANRTTIRELGEAAGTNQPVRVTGSWSKGVEAGCDWLNVNRLEHVR